MGAIYVRGFKGIFRASFVDELVSVSAISAHPRDFELAGKKRTIWIITPHQKRVFPITIIFTFPSASPASCVAIFHGL